jgi:hypothetical protein
MNNKMKFLCAFLGSALTLGAASANAWEIRRAHAECNAFQSTNFRFDGGNNSTGGSLSLGCALPDENDLPHQAITQLNVHFESNTTSSSGAGRCVQFPFATGGACAGATFTSGFGLRTVSPTALPTGWGDGANFAYLHVIVAPKTSSGAVTTLKGFFASNN